MEVVTGGVERLDQAERFERLIQPPLAGALGLATRCSATAAEDAVQEAATKAWRARTPFGITLNR